MEDDIVINRVNSIEYLGKCAHIKELLEDTVYESNMMRMHFDPDIIIQYIFVNCCVVSLYMIRLLIMQKNL